MTAPVTTLADREPESTSTDVRRIAAGSPQREAAEGSNGGTPRQTAGIRPVALIHYTDSKYNPAGRRRSWPAIDGEGTMPTKSPMPIDPTNENTLTRAGNPAEAGRGLRNLTGDL